MTARRRRWTRAGLIYLAASFLQVGLWATLAPRSFYDDFPGFGRSWVAGHGPYNEHLASDAGVGFLAVGAVLVLAAVWMERRVMQAALVGATLHGLGHLLSHLNNWNDGLGPLDQTVSNGGLLFGIGLAIVLMAVVARSPANATCQAPATMRPPNAPAGPQSAAWG